jgi:hypothetical protein
MQARSRAAIGGRAPKREPAGADRWKRSQFEVNVDRRSDASIIGASSPHRRRPLATLAKAPRSPDAPRLAMAPLTTKTVVCSHCEEELVLGYAPSSRVAYVCTDCEERAVVRAQNRRRALLSVVIAVAFLLARASAALLGLQTEGPPTRDPVTPGR